MSLEVEDFLHVCQCCRDSSCGEQSAAPPAGQDVVELKVESDSPHVAVLYSPMMKRLGGSHHVVQDPPEGSQNRSNNVKITYFCFC